MRKIYAIPIAIGSVFLLLFIIGAVSYYARPQVVIRTVTVTATVTTTAAPTERQWRTVYAFDGVEDKTTEPFAINAPRFRIKYHVIVSGPRAQYALFSFFVYKEGEPGYIEMVTAQRGGMDVTYVYSGPGRYYIKVLAANLAAWFIEVQVEV